MMDEDARTLYCGNLSDKVSEDVLYELFLQGGPVQKISIPKDRDGKPRSFAFITYKHSHSVEYALQLFEGTMLYNRPLNMRLRNNEESPQQAEQSLKSVRNMNQMLELGQQMIIGNYVPQSNNDVFGTNGLHNTSPTYPKHFEMSCSNNDKNRNYPYQRTKDKNHERNRNKDRNRKHENKDRNRDRNREHNLNDYSRNDKAHYNRESNYARYRPNGYSHHNENRKRWTYH